MKKYTLSNLLFTFLFLIVLIPLCYLLYNHVLSYWSSPVSAKTSYHEFDAPAIEVNRDFTGVKEYADKVTVLMYHQIIPKKQLNEQHYAENGELKDSIVTLEDFSEQMNYLKENNYPILSLKEFELFMSEKKKVPEKSVLITFDDGYKNVFEFAYPVLKQHGFFAVHFIITGRITDKTVEYDPSDHQYASIEEINRSTDVFDYGNHTHSLHQKNNKGTAYLKAYSPDKVKKDLAKASKQIGNSTAFAAPYGEYSTTTLNILKELDMKMAFTVKAGYAEPTQHTLEIPRQAILPSYTMKDFKYILTKHE
ncbi:polysaccharide deacetylase family protein [Radiobacillus deserti]|uniref:polysaccharide deacetylase family protein n=1 Tax=Radiobacillus deserti TaxID=2594883 RepID=UPI0013156CB1|nr:polysaccharide deacetylase family protein [Radiobacillus deserti]